MPLYQKLCHVKRIHYDKVNISIAYANFSTWPIRKDKSDISGRLRSFYTIQYKKASSAKVCVTLFLDLSIFRRREALMIYIFSPIFCHPFISSRKKKWKEKMTFDGSTQQYSTLSKAFVSQKCTSFLLAHIDGLS